MNEIRELTEMDIEAVSGGGLVDIGVALNVSAPVALAIGGAGISVFGGPATGGGATGANLLDSLNGIHL
jgi:hypothetical protein